MLVAVNSTLDSIYQCEGSFVKVPLEEFKRTLKTVQRIIERDFSLIHSFFSGKAANTNQDDSVIKKGIEMAKKRLVQLEERVKQEFVSLNQSLVNLQSRIELIEQTLTGKIGIDGWNELKILRLINDYLLRNNYMKTFQHTLKLNTNLLSYSDFSLFNGINSICQSLVQDHKTTSCLQWTAENKAFLRKRNSKLEFMLHAQEFVELARERKVSECIGYAKKTLTSFIVSNGDELQKIMGLLAVPSDTSIAKYQELYSQDRWTEIARVFREDAYSLYGLPHESLLVEHIQAGLSAIKTPLCGHEQNNNLQSTDCPACCVPFNAISAQLPYSHHENSRIVCRITGKLIDDSNPPMILPNGHVYSTLGLQELEKRSTNGLLKCPITGDEFDQSQIRKCFFTS